LVKNDIVASLTKSKSLNLSREENKAFHELLHNDKIWIRLADKGSGIVLVDKDDYINKLNTDIEQSDSYAGTDGDITYKDTKVVKKLVNKMLKDKHISKEMQQYLIPRYPRPGRIQCSPKIHKSKAPMRTIVNGINKLAEVAESELKEFVTTTPSYIQDTTYFLQKLSDIPEPLPEETILFCFDVCKLYPSVPQNDAGQ
jgi:hypothetical protein